NDSVYSITGFTTTGAQMVGTGLLTVTVFFSDGSNSGAIAWTNGTNPVTSADCSQAINCGLATGAAGNGGWVLQQVGDTGAANASSPNTTAVNPWVLWNTSTNLAIDHIVLNGNFGIVFDRDNFTNGQVGTPSSNFGIDYTFNSESGADSPFT